MIGEANMSKEKKIEQTVKDVTYAATAGANAEITIYNYNYYYKEIEAATVEADETKDQDRLSCPYRGLYHFSPNHAKFFFGREVFIQQLFKATQTHNFIPVLGASGSGKSSVVLAGLVPKLEQEKCWKFTHFRPSDGNDPFYALAKALVPLYRSDLDSTDEITQSGKLAKHLEKGELSLAKVFSNIQQKNPNHKVLLIVDQFEKLYTQYSDLTFRHRFLDCLLANFQSPNSRSSSSTVLVATMRADFLANALSYRPFADMLQNTDIKLGAMSRKELIQVIEKPAQTLGISFEEGLVERILDDVEHEPGHLPLLEFALEKLWDKRRGKRLTHAAYEELGKVNGALAKYADEKHSELTSKEQKQARQIFIQLIRPGEGNEDTRRRANRAELGEDKWDLINRKNGLADSRLVVTDRQDTEQETVEVVHEALIQNWGQLREWMDIDREFRAWQERLRITIQQWKDTKKDDGGLLRGLFLNLAENWLEKRPDDLSHEEREFIRLSGEKRDRDIAEEEAREREKRDAQFKLETITEADNKKKQIIRNGGIIGGGMILVAAIIAGFLGVQANKAIQEQQEAQAGTRLEQAGASILQQFQSLSPGASKGEIDILVEAMQIGQELKEMVKDGRPLAEYPATSPLYTLRTILDNIHERNWFYRDWRINDKENLYLLSGGINFSLGGQGRDFTDFPSSVDSKVFSSDGQLFVTFLNKSIQLWDLEENLLAQWQVNQDKVEKVEFSPDGKHLVIICNNDKYSEGPQTFSLWDLKGNRLAELNLNQNVSYLAFSPNGQKLAIASYDTDHHGLYGYSTIRLWDLKGNLLHELYGHQNIINRIAFSPDGQQLITEDNSSETVRLWDFKKKSVAEWEVTPDSEGFSIVGLSLDGQLLANVYPNGIFYFWDSKKNLNPLTKLHLVTKTQFSRDGLLLATSIVHSNAVQLWDTKGNLLTELKGHQDDVDDIVFSPDGQKLATASDEIVRLWDLKGNLLAELKVKGYQHWFNPVVFNPDGEQLAIASDEIVRLWDLKGNLLAELKGHQDDVDDIVFSPDGQKLATTSDNIIRLWETKGNLLAELKKHRDNINYIVFSPDGKKLATISDDALRLWDLKGHLLEELKGNQSGIKDLILSPEQKFINISHQGTKLWDFKGNLLAELNGYEVVLSPDGKLFATNSGNAAKLWNLKGNLLAEFKGHQERLGNIAFTPDGQHLATSSKDGNVRLWPIQNLDQLLERGCDWLNDYLITHPEDLETLEVCQNPSNKTAAASFLVNKGLRQTKDGQYNEAVSTYHEALKWNPNLTLDPETKAAPALVIQGENLVKEGKFIEAIARYKEAQKLVPEIDLYPETEAIDKDIETVLRLLVPEEELIVGVGINIYQDEETKQLVIESPIENTSAMMAGIKAKDIVTKIDDKSTEAMDLNEAIKHIGGSIGTEVKLTILRDGEELEFLLKRMPFKRRKNN